MRLRLLQPEAAREALTEPMGALEIERAALAAFLRFAAEHKEIYRIIDEAEFVDPVSYRTHYETIAARIHQRLLDGAGSGELRPDIHEAHAWALMGMNVFLGLRYAIWGGEPWSPDDVATVANDFVSRGLGRR